MAGGTEKKEQENPRSEGENGTDRRPLFDEEGDNPLNGEKKDLGNGVAREGENPQDESEEASDEGEDLEEEREGNDEILPEPEGRFARLKWVFVGVGAFGLVLAVSLFVASVYIHKKEQTIARERTKKIAIKPFRKPKVREKKVIIKQYELSPFFLRIKDMKTGEDHFLSIRLYIEFIRKNIPTEVKTKREILRTLVYRQLKKYFTQPRDSMGAEEKFKKNLVPTLNTFFRGGGVYDVGFKEFVVR